MTTKLLKELETALAETWGFTIEDLKKPENKFIMGCMAYWLKINGCDISEIQELFETTKATIYYYVSLHTNEQRTQKSIFFDLKIDLGELTDKRRYIKKSISYNHF